MTKNNAPQRPEIEALLPWHAAGTLPRRDAERVEAALANDNELARQYEIVREELGETIRLNESLGAPSARAMERLMAAIDAEPARARGRSLNITAWISAQLTQLSPRTLAWSATAATLAIVLQAGLIAGLYVGDRGQTGRNGPDLASYSQDAGATQGSFALVGFAPQATAADITKFLEANKASIVGGPRAGLFKVRVAPTVMPRDQLAELVRRMKETSAIVRFADPTE